MRAVKAAVFLLIYLQCCSAAQITTIDGKHGLPVRVVTSGEWMNTIFYPTCRTWSSDSTKLYIESSRPRPDGTKSSPEERQILEVDIRTGATRHLATLQVEDTKPYGIAHVGGSSEYHADISMTGVMVYYDMTSHNLYLMDVRTGRSRRILHETEGFIGDPPSISTDGTRIAYYTAFPIPESRWFSEANYAIFVQDIDPEALNVVGPPRLVLAYPKRKLAGGAPGEQGFIFANHVQISPANKDLIGFAHERGGPPEIMPREARRLWTIRSDGSDMKSWGSEDPGKDKNTHEVFGDSGRKLYYVGIHRDPGGNAVLCVDLATGKEREIYRDRRRPMHITVSPDEKWVAADTWDDSHLDNNGNAICSLTLANVETGKVRVVAEFPRGGDHPYHPHPNFSPDGALIAFVMKGPEASSQVAYVDVSSIVKKSKRSRQGD